MKRYSTAEKRFLSKYCDGVGDGPFYKDDLLHAFRVGRRWNIGMLFIDASTCRPKNNHDDIVVIMSLGDTYPFNSEYEFSVIKSYEYDNCIEKTPYKVLYWFRLNTLMRILKMQL